MDKSWTHKVVKRMRGNDGQWFDYPTAGITCTSDDFVIEHWESRGGYVHVDGVRVLGASGSTGVPVVTAIDLVCGSCSARHGGGHYTTPAVLWGRYEHALDRPMYYFSAAEPCPRHGCVTTRALAALEPCP